MEPLKRQQRKVDNEYTIIVKSITNIRLCSFPTAAKNRKASASEQAC